MLDFCLCFPLFTSVHKEHLINPAGIIEQRSYFNQLVNASLPLQLPVTTSYYNKLLYQSSITFGLYHQLVQYAIIIFIYDNWLLPLARHYNRTLQLICCYSRPLQLAGHYSRPLQLASHQYRLLQQASHNNRLLQLVVHYSRPLQLANHSNRLLQLVNFYNRLFDSLVKWQWRWQQGASIVATCSRCW